MQRKGVMSTVTHSENRLRCVTTTRRITPELPLIIIHYIYLPASFDERKKYINVHSEDFTSYLLRISPVWHKMWIVIEGLLSLWVRWPTPVVEAPSKAVYSSVGTESIVLCSLGIDLSANDFSTARHLGETVAVQCCNWICCIVCLPIRTDWCSCPHGAHLGPAFYEQFAQEKNIHKRHCTHCWAGPESI